MKRMSVVLILLGLCLASKPAAAQDLFSNSYEGRRPPEIAPEGAPAENWFNSKGPLSLESLRGRVVYLQFGFLG